MIYFALGFSISLNIFVISLLIFLFKKTSVSDKLIKNLEDTKTIIEEKNDPWVHSL